MPQPPAGLAGTARTLTQLSWLWLAIPAGVLFICCGGICMASSAITGSMQSLITTVPVLGAFLALTIVDKMLVTSEAAETQARQVWYCQRCGHRWETGEPKAVPPDRSRLSAAALRMARVGLMIVLPWKPAAFLFSPRHRLAPKDRVIELLSRIRVVLGLAIVVGVAIWYRSYSRLEIPAFVESWLETGLLAIPSCLICMGLLVAWIRSPLRRAAIRQMRWPALSLVAFIATIALLVLFSLGASYVSGRIEHYTGGAGVPLDDYVYGGVFGLWLLVFCLRSAYLVTQNWFNAVDGHLLLPPVIATWMAWLVAGKSLIFDGGVDGTPGGVSLVLIIGGAVATTGIAALEGWRAARVYGVTLRNGPWPAGQPQPRAGQPQPPL